MDETQAIEDRAFEALYELFSRPIKNVQCLPGYPTAQMTRMLIPGTSHARVPLASENY